jgi:hypothetical protein
MFGYIKTLLMKKIILAFDSVHFAQSAFDFAEKLNEKQPILLVGLFLPQISYANVWSYGDGIGGPLFIPSLEESESEYAEKNIEKFERLCQLNQIDYTVRKDFNGLALHEIKKESRFADLMLVGSQTFYENIGIGETSSYLKETLHDVECSTIVLPDEYVYPTKNILAYDGSPSSVYAIKQFIYLMPELADNQTVLLHINSDDKDEMLDESYIEELAGRHFKNLTVTKLDIDPKKYFATWVSDKKDSILVSGSFSRSAISTLFKKSFISDVLKEHKIPLFISHK